MTDDTRLARSQNSTPGGKCVRNVLHRFMFGELSMVRMMARMGLSNPSDEYPSSNQK